MFKKELQNSLLYVKVTRRLKKCGFRILIVMHCFVVQIRGGNTAYSGKMPKKHHLELKKGPNNNEFTK
jgi:hypothetical protein